MVCFVADEEAKRLMAELGSDTYTYSQVGFNYDGQAMTGDMTGAGGEQGSEYLEHYQVQQDDLHQQHQQQEHSSGYMPEADEDTYVPPAELNVPQGMVVVGVQHLNNFECSKFTGQYDVFIFDEAILIFFKYLLNLLL